MEEVKQAELDESAVKAINAGQIDLGLSDETQMRRTELNFYAEFYSALLEINKNISVLTNTVNIASLDKIARFLKSAKQVIGDMPSDKATKTAKTAKKRLKTVKGN